jgi:hypothetical protein
MDRSNCDCHDVGAENVVIGGSDLVVEGRSRMMPSGPPAPRAGHQGLCSMEPSPNVAPRFTHILSLREYPESRGSSANRRVGDKRLGTAGYINLDDNVSGRVARRPHPHGIACSFTPRLRCAGHPNMPGPGRPERPTRPALRPVGTPACEWCCTVGFWRVQ